MRRAKNCSAWVPLWMALVLFWSGLAWSQEKVTEGVIVGINGQEVVMDLGMSRDVAPGARVEVFRRLEVKHPVTGKLLVDHFPIGEMPLREVGKLLSISRGWESLSRKPQVGDAVRLAAEPVSKPAPVPSPKDHLVVAADPAREALEACFQETLGRSLRERIELWEQYLATWPKTAWTEQVAEELRWLYKTSEEPDVPVVVDEVPDDLIFRVSWPETLATDQPLEIHPAVLEQERVQSLRLLVRTKGASTYQTMAMSRNGALHWVLSLEDPALRQAGCLEFFVEAIHHDGSLESLLGTVAEPRQIVQTKPGREANSKRGLSRAQVLVEYVNFKTGDKEDSFVRFETHYRYKLRGVGSLSSFKVGVTIFDGEGGTVEEVEAGQTRKRAVNAGFAELSLAPFEYFGVSGRVSAGNHHQTENGTSEQILGLRLMARIGEEEGTRLDLGASLTEELGNEAWAVLTMDTIERFPVGVSVTATNLPVGGDLGVSLGLVTGWEVNDLLTLQLRTGWNARTINHYGFTGGLGVAMNW